MTLSRCAVGVLILSVLLSACTSTAKYTSSVAYNSTRPNPASPPPGGFAFALRATTVVLAPPGGGTDSGPAGAEAAPPAPQAAVAPPKTQPPKKHLGGADHSATPESKDKKDVPPPAPAAPKANPATNSNAGKVKITDVCSGKPDWKACLAGVAVSPAPISADGLVYVVKPAPPLGWKTAVTPKVNDTDPLFLQSVTFNTTSNLPTAITNAGGDAAAGLVLGPWGAALGGVFGFFTSLTQGAAPPAHPPTWTQFVCKNDPALALSAPLDPSTAGRKLVLPVTIDYAPGDADEATTCWHSVPPPNFGTLVSNGASSAGVSGWFYRFVASKTLPPHTSSVPPVITDVTQIAAPLRVRDDYFKSKDTDGWTTATTWPVSACRAVELQVTWWTSLDDSRTDAAALAYYRYPMIVADPKYVQSVDAPNQGSVTVLSVCGGYGSSGAPTTTVSDTVSAVLKQVQAIRQAESKN